MVKWDVKRKNFNHRESRLCKYCKHSFYTALMFEATQSYLSGTHPCCMHNPPGQEITRMNHVKKEIKVPPWEFLEARLSSVVTLHLATVSNCHGQWNAKQQSFWTVFVCDVSLFPKPGVCRNAKTIDLSGQRCVLKWYCEKLKDQILSGCPAEESQYQLHMFMSCHEASPPTNKNTRLLYSCRPRQVKIWFQNRRMKEKKLKREMLQYYTAYHQFWWGMEQKGPDAIPRSSTNFVITAATILITRCMCNI